MKFVAHTLEEKSAIKRATQKSVNVGKEGLVAKEVIATISMLLSYMRMIRKRTHTKYFHVLDGSHNLMIRAVLSSTLLITQDFVCVSTAMIGSKTRTLFMKTEH